MRLMVRTFTPTTTLTCISRRSVLHTMALAAPVGLLVWPSKYVGAQAPVPVTPAFSALGVTTWPLETSLVELTVPAIVTKGTISVGIKSQLPVTQKLIVLQEPNYRNRNPQTWAPEQLALFTLGPRQLPQLSLSLNIASTTRLVLLAQTPTGWYYNSHIVHVGRPAAQAA